MRTLSRRTGKEFFHEKSFAILIYDSRQDAPWHMKWSTYCCFLSDLTGFMGFHCTGPGDCHKSVLQSHGYIIQ